MSVALGLIVVDWPQTPEFLASAAGAWLLLLAGCRGLAALAPSPTRADPARADPARRPMARLTAPHAVLAPAPPKRSVLTRSVNAQSPGWTRPVRNQTGPAGPGATAISYSSVAKRVAVVEIVSCAGTGLVLMQADWRSRPAAIPIALIFAAVAVMVCAALDVLVARFSAEGYPRQRLIRAGVWMAAALLLMILLRSSAPAALATAAVLIGLVETGLGGWLLNRAVEERRVRGAADPLSMDDPEPRSDVDHAPLLGFLTGTDSDADPGTDFWPWAATEAG